MPNRLTDMSLLWGGVRPVRPEEAHSEDIQAGFETKKSDPVYCMADGSMILTRKDKWKEVKPGRIFGADSLIDEVSKGRGQISESVYCAHLGNSSEFWDRISPMIPNVSTLVFICDGSKWLWNYISDCYPNSIRGLFSLQKTFT